MRNDLESKKQQFKRPIITAGLAALTRVDETIKQSALMAEHLREDIHKAASELRVLWETVPTISFSPAPDLGYDPLAKILANAGPPGTMKRHTLRHSRIPTDQFREVTIDSRRRGIILRFYGAERLKPKHYLSETFALADGFHPASPMTSASALATFIISVGPAALRAVPKADYPFGPMWCSFFEVYAVAEGVTEEVRRSRSSSD